MSEAFRDHAPIPRSGRSPRPTAGLQTVTPTLDSRRISGPRGARAALALRGRSVESCRATSGGAATCGSASPAAATSSASSILPRKRTRGGAGSRRTRSCELASASRASRGRRRRQSDRRRPRLRGSRRAARLKSRANDRRGSTAPPTPPAAIADIPDPGINPAVRRALLPPGARPRARGGVRPLARQSLAPAASAAHDAGPTRSRRRSPGIPARSAIATSTATTSFRPATKSRSIDFQDLRARTRHLRPRLAPVGADDARLDDRRRRRAAAVARFAVGRALDPAGVLARGSTACSSSGPGKSAALSRAPWRRGRATSTAGTCRASSRSSGGCSHGAGRGLPERLRVAPRPRSVKLTGRRRTHHVRPLGRPGASRSSS